MAGLGLVLIAHGLSLSHSLQAAQEPRISLDMVTSGNGYSDPGSGGDNSMAVGAIDQCVSEAANNNAHNRTAHLIVQNVEDLAGVQTRFNFDSTKAAVTNFISAPFQDSNTIQNVGFLNLPLDPALGNNHRDLTGASDLSRPNTALVSVSYLGDETFPMSPDTPPKSPTPDDTSYSAPGGGIVGTVVINVRAGQQGQPSLYVDLGDGIPNAPGSSVDVFTGNGIQKANLASSDLGDGYIGNGVPCLPLPSIPPVPIPPPPSPPTPPPAGADSGNMSTDHCRVDINADTWVDGTDITLLAGQFGKSVPPAPDAYDLAPEFGDGYVDGTDITYVAGPFGKQCFGSTWTVDTGGPTEANAIYVGPCEFDTAGISYGFQPGSSSYVNFRWGGKSLCQNPLDLQIVSKCYFWEYYFNEFNQQETAAISGTEVTSGNYCVAGGEPAHGGMPGTVPCNVDFQGMMWLEVRWLTPDGQTIYGPTQQYEPVVHRIGCN